MVVDACRPRPPLDWLQWVKARCGFEAAFEVCWYPGRYDGLFMSILPGIGGVIDYIPKARRPPKPATANLHPLGALTLGSLGPQGLTLEAVNAHNAQ